MTLDGHALTIRRPEEPIRQGVFLVPEDRRAAGLVVDLSIRENVSLPALGRYARPGSLVAQARASGAWRPSAATAGEGAVDRGARRHVSAAGTSRRSSSAKWLALEPNVLIFDEPTRGIDVGAKAEIYGLLRELARGGRRDRHDQQRHGGDPPRQRSRRRHARGAPDRRARAENCTEERIMRLAVGQQSVKVSRASRATPRRGALSSRCRRTGTSTRGCRAPARAPRPASADRQAGAATRRPAPLGGRLVRPCRPLRGRNGRGRCRGSIDWLAVSAPSCSSPRRCASARSVTWM